MLSLLTLLLASAVPTGPMVPADRPSTAATAPNPIDVVLQQVMADIHAGQNAEALNLLNPLGDAVTDKMKSTPDLVFCAHSGAERLIYLARAHPTNTNVRVLGGLLCEVLFMRAYVLENLHRLPEAIEQLRQLNVREPDYPHYQVEYASALRQAGDMDAALAGYRRAVELAAPSKDYALDQAAALRGIGFILTDRGDLDGAEKAYHQSLDLAPGHPLALKELAYIAHVRATGAKTPAQTFESSINPADAHVPDQRQHP